MNLTNCSIFYLVDCLHNNKYEESFNFCHRVKHHAQSRDKNRVRIDPDEKPDENGFQIDPDKKPDKVCLLGLKSRPEITVLSGVLPSA